jgi:hypothetical protein
MEERRSFFLSCRANWASTSDQNRSSYSTLRSSNTNTRTDFQLQIFERRVEAPLHQFLHVDGEDPLGFDTWNDIMATARVKRSTS